MVLSVKVGPDGSMDRLKARFVDKGYTWVYGEDYLEMFSLVVKTSYVKIFLSLVANFS